MKQYFDDMVFSDELELWSYLQSLKDLDLGIQDGHYCVEFIEGALQTLHFRCVLMFSGRRELNQILYHRPRRDPRAYIYIRNSKPYCMGVESAFMRTHEERNDHGVWELTHYFDWAIANTQKRQFTPEEHEAAMSALVELLVVNSKKVA